MPDFSGLPRTAAGSMGDEYSNLANELLSTVPALTYPLSNQTYNNMRRDPQISAVLKAYTYPLRMATYAVNPTGCRDEVVQLVADAWGLPVAGDESGPGPARRRGVQWEDHIRLALLMLPFGHSPFAVRYEIVSDPMRAVLAELSERLPMTITDIVTNDDGSLKGIHQNGYSSNGRPRLIPAEHLLWYVHDREGAAWQGRSMIAESYGPWLLKHEMWRVLAQSSRRFGMGVPNVETGPNPTPTDVTAAADLASKWRAGDQSGMGIPQGWKFNLTGLTGSVPDTLGFVRYLDDAIASSMLAEILNLDTASSGNRALGETVIGLLQMSWKAVAQEITGPATRLNVQMVDYNFGEDEPVPAIICTDINRPEITSEAIASLVTCGAITPDLGMENELRTRYQMPVITNEERSAAKPPPTPPPGVPSDPAPTAPASGGGRTNEQVPA